MPQTCKRDKCLIATFGIYIFVRLAFEIKLRQRDYMKKFLSYFYFLPGLFMFVACGGQETASKIQSTRIVQSASASALTPLERGKKLYRRCIACHTLGEGEKHKVGPNLYGVFGQAAGSKKDFNYSKAMKASEIVWNDETLDAYIMKPRDYIPGNRMSFAGLKKAEDRAAVIAYMKKETQ